MTKLVSALALAAFCVLSLNAEQTLSMQAPRLAAAKQPTLSELAAKLDALKESIKTVESVARDTYSLLKSRGPMAGGLKMIGGEQKKEKASRDITPQDASTSDDDSTTSALS